MGLALKKIINTTVGSTESLTRVIPIFKELNENVGISDAVLKFTQKLELNDTIGSTETISFILGFNKFLNETMGIAETNSGVPGFFKALGDVVGVAEGIITAQPFGPQVIESIIGTSEAVQAFIKRLPAIDKTVGIIEGILQVKAIVEIFNSTIGVTETSVSNLGIGQIKVLNSTVGLVETVPARFYQDVGLVFRYTASNYAKAVNWYLEGRATGAATAPSMRLYNFTDKTEVVGSVIRFILVGEITILRSAKFSLVDGKEYQVQIGRTVVDNFTEELQARLVGARN